jgi:hypothetical protein
MPRPTFLLLLGTPEGLAYVLRERQMAFPPNQRIQLKVNDQVLLYTTRGVFRNAPRDLGRVVGTAEIVSPVASLASQRKIGNRVYTSGCELKITGLAPLDNGVVLADIVERLDVFQPHPHAWSARMRRSILPLPSQDVDVVMSLLKPTLLDPSETAGSYLERAAHASKLGR